MPKIVNDNPCVMEELKAAYLRLLAPVADRLGDGKDGVTCSPFMVGDKYGESVYQGAPVRFLFVGRAVNGWEIDFQGGDLPAAVEQVFASAQNMRDVGKGKVVDAEGKTYNYNRSPFFQLCHAVLNQYGIEENWSEYMAWTNLYKVSPYNAGNPNNRLIRQTLKDCAEILGKEISILQPTHIVFITDAWWYKPSGINADEMAFVKETGVNLYENTEQFIIGHGISERFHFHPRIVVTKRPERSGSRNEQAKAIFDTFAGM